MQNGHIEHELFLLMLHLAQRKSLAEIRRTLIEALNSLWPEMTFREATEIKDSNSANYLPIATTHHSFGAIEYHPGSHELSAEEQALIRNGVNMTAIIMANLHQNQMRENELRIRERLRYENYFKTALDKVRLYAVTLDTNGTVLFCNQYFTEKTGWTNEDLLGRNWFEICEAENLTIPVEREKFNIALRSGSLPMHVETALPTKYGEDRTVLWNNVMLYDHEQRAHSVTSIGADLTDQKQAEAQLREELNEKNTLLKEIHHRVKNNLNVVTSLLNLQKNEISDIKSARRAFEESQKRIVTMALVHEDLYQSAKLSEINMGSYIPTLVARHRELFQDQKNLQFEIDIDNVFLDITKAVPVGLIVNELLTNTYSHAFGQGDHGAVHICLVAESDSIYKMHFEDNGRGFPEGFNFESTSSLGLNLIRILSQQIDGKYQFSNQQGASFVLEFPLHQEQKEK